MKKIIGLLVLCTITCLGTVSGASTPAPLTVHYQIKLQSAAFGNCGVRKMWIKGDRMRWEGKSERLPVCIVKNKQGTFLIHPWKKIVAKYPKESPRGNPKAIFPGPTGSVKAFLAAVNADKSGSEIVEGKKCTIYTFLDPASRRQCKFWIHDKSNKPVKLLMRGKRSKMDTLTATYTKFEIGGNVSDSLFELPKGYKVRSMPTDSPKNEAKRPVKMRKGSS